MRIMEIMNTTEFQLRIIKKNESHRIPHDTHKNDENHRIQCENNENNENYGIPYENHENHENLISQ